MKQTRSNIPLASNYAYNSILYFELDMEQMEWSKRPALGFAIVNINSYTSFRKINPLLVFMYENYIINNVNCYRCKV